jgi:putative transposase
MHTEFYHVLNRGVDKRKIFNDSRDYARFVHDLYEFNSTERVSPNNGRVASMMDIRRPSFTGREGERLVDIHFFCLMPNHYHLLLSPCVEGGISLFMKKVNMGYAKYFNERNERSGSLFQGKYKSIHITSDAHFLYLPFYIHLNPFDMYAPEWRTHKIPSLDTATTFLEKYRWSSHLDYLGNDNFPSVTNRTFFLDMFNGTEGYTTKFLKYLSQLDISEVSDVSLE